MLKEPYNWVVDNSGTKQPGLELTWTLDFNGRGRQGRVRAKVRKTEEPMTDRERRLRTRVVPAPPPPATVNEPDDEEEEEDYEDEDDDDMSSDDEDEEPSEFIDTPRR